MTHRVPTFTVFGRLPPEVHGIIYDLVATAWTWVWLALKSEHRRLVARLHRGTADEFTPVLALLAPLHTSHELRRAL